MNRRKRKGGRPSLGKLARSKSVLVKITEDDHAAVRRAVERLVRAGKRATIAGWFRDRGLAALRRESTL